MQPYLVRTVGDRQLVGIYVVDSIGRLRALVDDCIDPDECECCELPPGGVQWIGPAVDIPVTSCGADEPEAGPFVSWADACETSSWHHYLYGAESAWRRLR